MKLKFLCLISAFPMVATIAAQEWTVIFDGKSTDGLRGYHQKTFPTNGWVTDGDAIKTVAGTGGDVITKGAYEDFELELEWKVKAGANSGIIYRVAETNGPTYSTGPEMQVLDDLEHPDGRNPRTSAGALYALIAPNAEKKLNPVGQWNKAKVLIKKGHVEHWLNGTKILEYEWDSPEVRQLITASKFKDMTGFMKQKRGHIAFQHHGDEVWYRDIRIRTLP